MVVCIQPVAFQFLTDANVASLLNMVDSVLHEVTPLGAMLMLAVHFACMGRVNLSANKYLNPSKPSISCPQLLHGESSGAAANAITNPSSILNSATISSAESSEHTPTLGVMSPDAPIQIHCTRSVVTGPSGYIMLL